MTTSKLDTSLLYILETAGDMEIMRLAKLLYLADYVYAKTFGNKHGFIDEHQRYKYGPVPAGFYSVYNRLLDEKVISRKGNTIKLKIRGLSGLPQLEEEELACLDKVIEDFAGKSLTKVKETAYATEPMIEVKKEEEKLSSGILEFKKMDFSSVKVHPLMKPIEEDLSFMDTPDFRKNLA